MTSTSKYNGRTAEMFGRERVAGSKDDHVHGGQAYRPPHGMAMTPVPYSSMSDRGSDRWKSVGGGVALATAALTTVVHAQTPANLANALRPATDPAAQLQTLLNFQDAEYRREFFANTPIAERILMDYGGYFRYGFSEVDDSSSQAQYLNTYDARLYGRVEIDIYARLFGRLRI